MSEFEKNPPLTHVAIIMDGNGRWAKKRLLPRVAGHNAGMMAMKEIVRRSAELGIKYLTVYAFSTENWKRSDEEVGGIFRLLVKYVDSELAEITKNNVRVRVMGDYSPVPAPARESLEKAESFFMSLGFGRTVRTDMDVHDRIIAFTSQLAHVVSNAYVKSPTAKIHRGFSAGSYKDLTRVAWLSEQMWSVRTLSRNINTQYYGRRMACYRESLALPKPIIEDNDTQEYIKSPVIAEFLGFRKDSKFDESKLEQALIDNLEQFIMELGRGFAFVDRQKHIVTDTADYYIDLVFYNIKLKRYVLFELKTHELTHQDVGQLDMYVRMYDDMVKDDSDNPTIGILLCTNTDKTIARYSVLHKSEQLFASKYMAYMPTEEELRREIETQKRFFMEQHGKGDME